MNVTTTINAGQSLEFYEPGDFFRIMDADSLLTVVYYANGKELARAEGVGEGYAERFAVAFDRLVITTTTTQAIQVVARLGNTVDYDKAPTGAVVTDNAKTGFTQNINNANTVSGNLLVAKANRQYLLIQNKDVSTPIYVNLTGAPATITTGIEIVAGGSLELSAKVPVTNITAIAPVTNGNVIVVEA